MDRGSSDEAIDVTWKRNLRIVVVLSSAIGVSFKGKRYTFCYYKGNAGQ